MRPVVFSASSVNSYQDCHLQWYFSYVLVEPQESTEPQEVGISVHQAAEALLRGALPVDAFDDWPIAGLIHVFAEQIQPTYRNPILIEAAFQIEVNDIPFSGILDAVDEHDMPWGTALILRDLKTTGSRPRPGKYRFAMTGYQLGAEDILGRPIDAAQLDYIVRTKTPYYWPEALEPIEEADVEAFAATLTTVARQVEAGDFRPTGLGTRACTSCGHRAICGPYQRFTEEVNRANGSN